MKEKWKTMITNVYFRLKIILLHLLLIEIIINFTINLHRSTIVLQKG